MKNKHGKKRNKKRKIITKNFEQKNITKKHNKIKNYIQKT